MRTFLLVIVFLISSKSFGQNYSPFPEDSAIWIQNSYGSNGSYGPPMVAVSTGNDTLITGTCYNQVYTGVGYFKRDVTIQDMIYGYGYSFAYRNDVPNKKVYRIDRDEEKEYLWYDFDLKKGDTIKAKIGKGLVITRIDSVVSTYGRKYYTNLLFRNDTTYLIEGVGNLFGLNSTMGFVMDNYTLLDNFGKYDSFQKDKKTCLPLLIVDKSETSLESVEVFPNPSNGIFSVKLNKNTPFLKMNIYDAFGNLVLKTENSGNSIEMPSYCTKGVYFLELENSKRVKFLVQ